jgi:hypothetical protein
MKSGRGQVGDDAPGGPHAGRQPLEGCDHGTGQMLGCRSQAGHGGQSTPMGTIAMNQAVKLGFTA